MLVLGRPLSLFGCSPNAAVHGSGFRLKAKEFQVCGLGLFTPVHPTVLILDQPQVPFSSVDRSSDLVPLDPEPLARSEA